MEREQFELGDIRSLDEVMRELLVDGYIPSFCTACYRLGRTGEQFMEFAIPGFIQNLCTPNALTTLHGVPGRLRLARDPRSRRAADRRRSWPRCPTAPRKQRAASSACSGSRRPTSGTCISDVTPCWPAPTTS